MSPPTICEALLQSRQRIGHRRDDRKFSATRRSSNPFYPDGTLGETFRTHAELVACHVQREERIAKAVARPRKDRPDLCPEAFAQITAKRSTAANSGRAWCEMAATACRWVGAADRAFKPRTNFLVATLAERKFAFSYDQAQIDLSGIKRAVEHHLRGADFVGFLEPGYYPRLNLSKASLLGTISWHAHVIVLVRDELKLKRRIDYITAHNEALFPDRDVAHESTIVRHRFAPRVRYICKGPIVEYRATQSKGDYFRSDSGLLIPSKSQQWKDDVSVASAVKVANLLTPYSISDLMISGGKTGSILHREVSEEFLRWASA
jgi:hypothetical protein